MSFVLLCSTKTCMTGVNCKYSVYTVYAVLCTLFFSVYFCLAVCNKEVGQEISQTYE